MYLRQSHHSLLLGLQASESGFSTGQLRLSGSQPGLYTSSRKSGICRSIAGLAQRDDRGINMCGGLVERLLDGSEGAASEAITWIVPANSERVGEQQGHHAHCNPVSSFF
jgi:hypothetical protein